MKTFASTIQTLGNITSGGTVTGTYYSLPHGLGGQPQVVGAYLQCVTADSGLGVSVGQTIPVDGILDGGNDGQFATLYADATDIIFSGPNVIAGMESAFTVAPNGITLWGPSVGVSQFSDFTKYRLVIWGLLF